MAKRGRPKSNGHMQAWMFFRDVFVLSIYNGFRSTGEKHSSAVTSTVLQFQQRHLDMPISETEVKRILARWQPSGFPSSLFVRNMSESEIEKMRTMRELAGIPCTGQNGIGFTFNLGPRPNYKGINRKDK